MSSLEMLAFTENISKEDLKEMLHSLLLTGAKYIYFAGHRYEWGELKEEWENLKLTKNEIH